LFERSCDDVLKSYQEIDKSHLELLWTDIPTTDKLNLYRLALNDAVKMEGRLSVLGSCVRLWACEFCLQAKWSQKAQYLKRVRLVFLLISHEKMVTLSYTQVDANVKKTSKKTKKAKKERTTKERPATRRTGGRRAARVDANGKKQVKKQKKQNNEELQKEEQQQEKQEDEEQQEDENQKEE
jgi:hypothetical protein